MNNEGFHAVFNSIFKLDLTRVIKKNGGLWCAGTFWLKWNKLSLNIQEKNDKTITAYGADWKGWHQMFSEAYRSISSLKRKSLLWKWI